MKNKLTIAIPKGRLGDQSIKHLQKIGYGLTIDDSSRKLIFSDQDQDIEYLFVKPSDVIPYVQSGVCDLGIIGKDILLESETDMLELLELPFGFCKFAIAGRKSKFHMIADPYLKIATKYPKVTKLYFDKRCQKIDIFKLNGSVELAPIVELSDFIVDIVETGSTLKANGLEILENIMDIQAVLVSNRSSYYLKKDLMKPIIESLELINEVTI